LILAYAIFPIVLRADGLLLSRRLARYGAVILAAGAVAGFLFDDLSMVAATMGVVSAALVISLQDVCTSMFGWFVIMLGGKFSIGHRLEVDGATGDVIDIQLLRTTLLEINGWLGTDQPTGRVIILPNNFIFKTKIFNYSHGHPHIWSKIDLTVAPGTPIAQTMALFQRVLMEETLEEFSAARADAGVMKKRYGIEDATYEPRISTKITDIGVMLTLYYVSHYKKVSSVRNRINRRMISELENRPEIQLANPTMNLVVAKGGQKPSAVLGSDVVTKPPFPVTATTAEPPLAEDVRVEALG
jgi:small-conductance mechanosensitive channel